MSLGFAIRDAMNGIAEAPGKTWFWELSAAVIDADRCIQCGACVAACPSDSIGVSDAGLPKLVKMCTGCSLCWDFCPRGGLRYESLWPAGGSQPDALGSRQTEVDCEDWKITGAAGDGLGVVKRAYAARVQRELAGAQDGGVVSQILIAALDAGDIDGALLARESATQTWKAEPFIARTAEEIRTSSGSFYNQTMALSALDLSSYNLPDTPRIALVGTPCEIQGLRALQVRGWARGKSNVDSVVLTIALLCTKSFDYGKLMLRELRDNRGIDLKKVGKVDVIHGKMIVDAKDGTNIVSEPVKDFHGAALKGCDECADFLGRSADISVGSVGSNPGWSSVMVRTGEGQKAFDRAWSAMQVRDLDNPEALLKLDALDKRVAGKNLHRGLDPDGPMFIDFAEHLVHYAGTDRDIVGSS
ncbi:MAG TPA: Coenzyme F420 hydrogenase/dehydrogenase, beta subunit C-terminal domain [Acidimicrobiales bacterium]|nr:Coenzyme F420 hydrogenase/dehydrogenase, beta subunit C-terminal domain [Acidimicrobiales bacterium]